MHKLVFLLPLFLLACQAGMHKNSLESRHASRKAVNASNSLLKEEANQEGSQELLASGVMPFLSGKKNKDAGVKGVLLKDYNSDLPAKEDSAQWEAVANATANAPLSEVEEKALQSKVGLDFELDVQETKGMQQYFKYYTHKHRKTFSRWLERAETYLPYVKKVFVEEGLPHELIFLPFAESGFNPRAYSHAGAAGLWQFIPGTARRYGLEVNWWVDERRDPYLSTKAAAKYLKKLYNDFGDWYLALAAYNAGEGRVAQALRQSGCDDYFELIDSRRYLHRETRLYVPKLLAILKIVKNLDGLGFDALEWQEQDNVQKLQVRGGTDLLGLCTRMDMSWKEFRKLNPAFRRQVSPPRQKSNVYVPQEKLKQAKAYLEDSNSRPYSGYTRYRVSKGDSWWRISQNFNIPISVLKQVNNRSSNLLRPGQSLMIPHSATSVTRSRARKRANYTLRKGDTLWDVAKRFGVGLETLYRANGISDPRTLRPGEKIYVPDMAPGRASASAQEAAEVQKQVVRYRVRRGDTLWDIARRFGVHPRDLQKWNGISRKTLIHPGDKLKVYVD